MSTEALPKTFLSVDWPSTFEMGCLVLPREFKDEYGQTLPEKVILIVPSGVQWMATFDMKSGTVGGLQSMIKEYALNKYNFPLMQYNGGASFELRIFNCYAGEIDYNPNRISLGRQNSVDPNINDSTMQEIELDKFEASFKLNICNNNLQICQFEINSNHLSIQQMTQILSKTHISELNLDKSTKYIHVGFRSKRWKIEFENCDDNIYFSRGWNEFAKSCGLSVGDICCFDKTDIQNSFQVAIYHARDMKEWKALSGEELRKSRAFFLHMTTEHSLLKAEIVMPKMFVEMYGAKLESIVSLWMADNNIWITSYRKKENCLFGLQRLQKHYSIQPKSLIVLQYCGKSTFYISILRPDGYDILNGIRWKMLVGDVVMDDESSNPVSLIENMSEEEENAETHLGAEDQHFSVYLTSCHFDTKCHGVYIPRSMATFYESWKPAMLVTLRYENEQWQVKGNLAGKRCRLGRGWSDFISETPFIVGQKLTFCYIGSSNFLFEIKV